MRKKIWYCALAMLGLIGIILSVIMFVSAIRFGELGRVIAYSFTAVICLELTIFSIVKLIPKETKSNDA